MGKKSKRKSRTSEKSEKPLEYFYNGTSSFTLPNGDTYTGDYCAHRNGMLWREGHGSYCTHDGHVYEGEWRDDKLIDSTPLTVAYPNGDIFEGTLQKNKYERSGSVLLKDGLRISANFEANKPIGTCHIIDPTGQLWKSYPEEDTNQPTYPPKDIIYCRPEQVFFSHIHPLRGIKKELLKDIEPEWTSESMCNFSMGEESRSSHLGVEDIEKMIFTRKTKVGADTHDWNDSPWYKHFVEYKEKREKVLSKVETHEKLTSNEKKWYQMYVAFKRKKRLLQGGKHGDMQKPVDPLLLEKFYSEEHRTRSKPYSVIYPSYFWRSQNEEQEVESVEEESSQSSTELFEGMHEEGSYHIEEESDKVEEESVTPNPSIGCGTSSLFNFVQVSTGAQIINTCKSVF